MYTEYIFSNKDYEIALRTIKASLFDIVTREEANISSLREKAFSQDYGAAQASLQELFVRQDACLRTILSISDQLSDALKKVDACSRDLKIIEKKNMEQIVAHVNENPQVPVAPVVQEEEPVIESQPMVQEEVVNEKPNPQQLIRQVAVDIEKNDANEVPQPVMEEVVDGASSTNEEPIVDEGDAPQEEEEVLMTYDDSLSTIKDENAPTEEGAPQEEEEVLMTYDDSLSTIKDENAPAEEGAPQEEEEVLMTYDDSLSTIKDENAPTEEGAPQEEEEVLMTYDDSLSTIKDENAPTEENTEEVGPVLTPVISTDTITTDEPVLTVTPVEESPSSEPVLTIEPTETGAIEESTPTVIEPSVVFKKKTDSPAKVIMVSTKQFEKLVLSLTQQEALLKEMGLFSEYDATSSNKQQEIEKLMNQANELYAAGKVDEAQKIYDEISALNSQTSS